MKTYEEILGSMKSRYTELTGVEPDEASDIGVRISVLAGELFSAYAQLEWLKHQMFPNTAEGEWLDRHAFQRQITRKEGRKAEGEVEFYLPYQMSFDVTVPQGTICATAGDDPVRFETVEDTTITSGRLSARAPVRALEIGAKGNVAEMNICVIVTPVTGVSRVENDERTVHGADRESDEALRERVIDSFCNIPNGTNIAFYKNTALSVDGVTAVGVIPQRRGPGTVDVYITDESPVTDPTLIRAVREKLLSEREVNVDVSVQSLTILTYNIYMQLSVRKGYDFSAVKAQCEEALKRYMSTLGGGENVYVTSLAEAVAHVEGVKDFSFIDRLTYDSEIAENCVARCGSVSISERD